MKMTELWGYRLVSTRFIYLICHCHLSAVHALMSSNVSQAEHPTDKSIRASYRASSHLSVIHDASYMGCVELGGPEEALVRMLNMVTDPTMPSIGSARCGFVCYTQKTITTGVGTGKGNWCLFITSLLCRIMRPGLFIIYLLHGQNYLATLLSLRSFEYFSYFVRLISLSFLHSIFALCIYSINEKKNDAGIPRATDNAKHSCTGTSRIRPNWFVLSLHFGGHVIVKETMKAKGLYGFGSILRPLRRH